jgi:hypothetical protein
VKSFFFPMAAVVCLLTFIVAAPAAHAKGCIKGALVGGVAGHFAHHGLLGAAAGCVVGHHMATKHTHGQSYQGYGSSEPSPGAGR